MEGLQQPTLPFLFNPQQGGQSDQSIQPLAPPEGFPQFMHGGGFGQQADRKDVQYPERPGQPECQVSRAALVPERLVWTTQKWRMSRSTLSMQPGLIAQSLSGRVCKLSGGFDRRVLKYPPKGFPLTPPLSLAVLHEDGRVQVWGLLPVPPPQGPLGALAHLCPQPDGSAPQAGGHLACFRFPSLKVLTLPQVVRTCFSQLCLYCISTSTSLTPASHFGYPLRTFAFSLTAMASACRERPPVRSTPGTASASSGTRASSTTPCTTT